eukprot:5300994-Prymnesium_polylepis.1
MLLSYGATPAHVRLGRLFHPGANRYHVGRAEWWQGRHELARRRSEDAAGKRRSLVPRVPTGDLCNMLRRGSSAPLTSRRNSGRNSGRSSGRNSGTNWDSFGEQVEGWELLLRSEVEGYKEHLQTRRVLERVLTLPGASVPEQIKMGTIPKWADLMLWSILSDHSNLVSIIWRKTELPLRVALVASQVCKRLARHHFGLARLDQDRLAEQSTEYEGWA